MSTTIGEDQFPKPGVEEVFQVLAKKGIFSSLVLLKRHFICIIVHHIQCSGFGKTL